MKNLQKGFTPIKNALIIAVIFTVSAGTVAYFKNRNGLLSSSASPQNTQPKFSEDLTNASDWKTYRNDKFSFEFMYSPEWKPKFFTNKFTLNLGGGTEVAQPENANEIRLAGCGPCMVTVAVSDVDSIDQWISKLKDPKERSVTSKEKRIKVDGADAFDWTSNFNAVEQRSVVILRKIPNASMTYEYTISINYDSIGGETSRAADVKFERLLSTFKFTSAVNSPTKESLRTILGNLAYGLPNQPQAKLTNGYYSEKFEECGNQSCNGIYFYVHKKLNDKIIVGDINGDGLLDAVVLIDSGQTPGLRDPNLKDENAPYTAQAIAAVVNQNGIYKNIAYINSFDLEHDLNARAVSIENIAIKENLIYVTIRKNEGSASLWWPDETESIQLRLNNASSNGFTILKDGIADVNSYAAPQITNAAVSGTGNDKSIIVFGRDFSLLRNYIVLTSQTGQEYRSMPLKSDQNNSRITALLSSVNFLSLGGNADEPPFDIRHIPAGKYEVTLDAYRCPERQSCRDVYSDPFLMDIP